MDGIVTKLEQRRVARKSIFIVKRLGQKTMQSLVYVLVQCGVCVLVHVCDV